MLLRGKSAIITGVSRGIGKAIALTYLSQGANVWAFGRKEGPFVDELKQKGDEFGGSFSFISLDISQEAEIREGVDRVIKESEGVDILVNNAGITKDGPLFSLGVEAWDDVINTNLRGPYIVSQSLVKHMMKRRSGSIVNITSLVGITGNGGQCNYSSSKAGLIGFTKSMAQEVAKRGIRVNAIAPGFIESDMTEVLPERVREGYLEQIPSGRFGDPQDVADVALFLASPLSSYITGEVIKVSGGLGM